MDQKTKALAFKALHTPGTPVVLYNIWDAGSAKTLEKAGAKALATGSMSVAAAQGYADGEKIPMQMLLQIVSRITQTTDLPVSVDFEGGYAVEPDHLAKNITQLIETGAVGLNFEDQIVGQEGLHSLAVQAERIRAIRHTATKADVPLVINARTDLFLKAGPDGDHAALITQASERAIAYQEAGADSFFVPGLWDLALIQKICEASPVPVNVMMRGRLTSLNEAANCGAGRASYGPGPYFDAMQDLTDRFNAL